MPRTFTPTVRQLEASSSAVPPLRRVTLLVAAVVLAAVLLSSNLAGSASAATTKRLVEPQPGSSLTIHDDESWPYSDVEQTFNKRDQHFGTVEPSRPVFVAGSGSDCAGEEVRIISGKRIEMPSYAPLGWVLVTVDLKMYEGASCYSNDLDGQAAMSFWIAPGDTVTKVLTVRNDDEGGDWATYTYKLKNADWTLS